MLYVNGNLFASPAKVLVNTVNTVGVMGKGIALEFRKLYPDMFKQYQELCESGRLDVGYLWLYRSPNKWVLNFPTKRHWRNPSRIEYIESGLLTFVDSYEELGITSIAFPPLGCGNGRLDFATQVQPLLEKYLRSLPIDVFIYPDLGGPVTAEHEDPKAMRKWLRSEPRAMPFSEVWQDIRELLAVSQQFSTATKGSPYRVEMLPDDTGLEIFSAKDSETIEHDVLQSFWQQLRDHGFSNRRMAPGLDLQMSYLVPLFAALPYVRQCEVTEDFGSLSSAPTMGLQVLPNALAETTEPMQMAMML